MHANLDRRFLALARTAMAHHNAQACFATRYSLLFAALAEDLGITPEALAARVGFDPVPAGGNAVMRGEAEPSAEDVSRLLEVYLATRK